ncbi:hypothetical protein StrepF001_27775 [Streptomyces sp. F001]|uniref:hypothetical protein n=1 Tax=Streptomyces sp. F001 TaxID=1510026 RepID=UPI00101E3DB3|nr:hypothetical protein [Streptomyces sp. F001]RZB16472.1 hypothetical protein StrepF001_27775 [Streptomyces sp. F001]
MKITRSTAVTAAAVAAAALAATGITYASASEPALQQVAPVQAPLGGDSGKDDKDDKDDDKDDKDHGRGDKNYDKGEIQINERSYNAHEGDCITVVSGLGAKTLNIRNDTRKRIEVFSGAVCDNGAPVAVVGPHSQSDGVDPRRTEGIHVKDGVVGSFRVIDDHHDRY